MTKIDLGHIVFFIDATGMWSVECDNKPILYGVEKSHLAAQKKIIANFGSLIEEMMQDG